MLTTCLRIGGDIKTLRRRRELVTLMAAEEGFPDPKYATAHDHPTAANHDSVKGGEPSFSSSSNPNAGMIPTKPAAKGI